MNLVARQTTVELLRKKNKARRRSIWTQEDVDWAYRYADETLGWFALGLSCNELIRSK